ncbi:MAG: alpha/beta hydrolase [Gammaproteobacteria bacterium]|nr:alpha/beta hydrolase [Gammaproteobacteria bacterium]MDE2345910.1 alpha/beta hydrolase [Gammaproteobacteria bacterium]
MGLRFRCIAGITAGLLLFSGAAQAQTTLRLWPGVAPGSEHWNWKQKVFHHTPMGTVVEDVVTPTLTVYLPPRSKATGTGILIAPGGACVALAINREGVDVARWLQRHGIAAFVLKYRLQEKTFEGALPSNFNMDKACSYGIADGFQALKVVRWHAAQWGIAPGRLGFMGFSAGGMLVSNALLQTDASARPDFAAFIYGAPFGAMPAIPPKLPPVFMAWSQNDDMGGYAMVRFYRALMKAGDKPEAHIFSAGGHGFGMHRQGTSSDHWIVEFYWWLQDVGFTKPLKR